MLDSGLCVDTLLERFLRSKDRHLSSMRQLRKVYPSHVQHHAEAVSRVWMYVCVCRVLDLDL